MPFDFTKKIRHSLTWSAAERCYRALVGAIVSILVARYLGPEKFGLLSYSVALVTMVRVFSEFGLQAVVARATLSRPADSEAIISSAVIILCVLSVLSYVSTCIFVTHTFDQESELTKVLLIVALSLLFTPFRIFLFWYESRLLARFIAVSASFGLTLGAVVKGFAIVTGAGVPVIAWAIAIEAAAISAALATYSKKSGFKFSSSKISKAEIIHLVKAGLPLLVSALSVLIYTRSDQLMIQAFLGEASVGIYSVPVQIIEFFYFVPVVVATSYFPSFMSESISDTEKRAGFTDLMAKTTVLASFLSVLLMTAGVALLPIIYGGGYDASSEILYIHSLSLVFVFMGVLSGKWLIMRRLYHHVALRTILGAVLNVIGNFILIPRYGVLGAAVASLFSQFFSAYLYHWFFNDTRELFIMKTNAIRAIPSYAWKRK